MSLAIVATVFGLIFIAELPDKTAVASLVLGTRYPAGWVFAGVSGAFLAHVVVAVTAGSLLTLLPQRPLEAVVALLFLVGAIWLWRERPDEDDAPVADAPGGAGLSAVVMRSFAVIFVAEWGDLTQILCANLAAHYHAPLSVGVGAVLGLWAVGLLAVLGGRTLLRVIPIRMITRVAAVCMVALAAYSLLHAIRG